MPGLDRSQEDYDSTSSKTVPLPPGLKYWEYLWVISYFLSEVTGQEGSRKGFLEDCPESQGGPRKSAGTQ